MDTVWFIFVNLLRVPLILLLYMLLGWLSLEFFYVFFGA